MKNKGVFLNCLKNNRKSFLGLIVLFLIGVVGGIFFINHASESQTQEICSYVNSLKENIKTSDGINKTAILKQSMKQNVGFVALIWFLGCTLFGGFFIYGVLIYKGFSIGYTVSAMIATLGIKSGSLFAIVSLLLQNLVFLPMVFILANSGIKLYQNVRQDRYANWKIELLRHTILALIAIVVSVIASFIEVYLSTNFLIFLKEIF